MVRDPVAAVFWRGKIAYPLITLTTWASCPFVIERVERVEVGVLRVVGRQATTRCADRPRRHTVSHRLSPSLRAGPGFEKRIIVESQSPPQEVDARVRRVLS